MSNKYRQQWMSNFESECTKLGVPYETMHGPSHVEFWNSATYYFTQRFSPSNAAERYYKVKVQPPTDLDQLKAAHDAKRNAMLAEPKNPV